MSNRLAIDFGTTRTKVAYSPASGPRPELLRFGGHRYLPYAQSLFYLNKDDDLILFGDAAERMLDLDPAGIVDVAKRRRHSERVRAGNGRVVHFSDLLVALFVEIRSKAQREIASFGGAAPSDVVLTLPTCFGPAETDLWKQGASDAGFATVETIAEPVAAAIGWIAAGGNASEGVIVLDCGGGTVDWALLRTDGNGMLTINANVPPDGIVDLGGHDIDIGLLELTETVLAERCIESMEFGTARRPRLIRDLRRVKETVSEGSEPPVVEIGSTRLWTH